MKLRFLFSAALIGLSTSAFAQTGQWTNDSVAMGVSYANDVFYGLKNSSTKYQQGNDWDLAFQMTIFGEPSFNATVWANHARQNMDVYSLHMSATAKWSTVTALDTVGKTGPAYQLINNDTSWGTGAFLQNRSTADPFSYGWGVYNMSTHYLTGDSLYLLQKRDPLTGAVTANYKFWVQRYISTPTDSIRYIFRIANLDGTNDQTVTLWRRDANSDYSGRLFAYYSITNNMVINREPLRAAWDLLFTRYRQLIPGPGGAMIPYDLTGVLTNLGLRIAEVRHLAIDDATFTTGFKTFTYSPAINTIGAGWKTYDMVQNKYMLDDSASYVIKKQIDSNTWEYWQIHFTRFDGGSAAGQGKIVFAKRFLATAMGVKGPASAPVTTFTVAPNPANAAATLLLDAKTASPEARLTVTDMAGRVMTTAPVALQSGINAFTLPTGNWPTGIYAVQVAGSDWKLSSRLVVVR